jgi:hypothetical protein
MCWNRKRARGISDEQVCIPVARGRTGKTLAFVTGNGALTKAQLHACLPPVIDKDVLLVTDGHPASAVTCPITWAGAGYSTPGASVRQKHY